MKELWCRPVTLRQRMGGLISTRDYYGKGVESVQILMTEGAKGITQACGLVDVALTVPLRVAADRRSGLSC